MFNKATYKTLLTLRYSTLIRHFYLYLFLYNYNIITFILLNKYYLLSYTFLIIFKLYINKINNIKI